MIRWFLLCISAAALAACAQYREPKANCFTFASQGPAAMDCTFEPLAGLDIRDRVDD